MRNCHLFKIPSTQTNFWKEKIGSKVERDKRHKVALSQLQCKVLTIWECACKGKRRRSIEEIINITEDFFRNDVKRFDIRGKTHI